MCHFLTFDFLQYVIKKFRLHFFLYLCRWERLRQRMRRGDPPPPPDLACWLREEMIVSTQSGRLTAPRLLLQEEPTATQPTNTCTTVVVGILHTHLQLCNPSIYQCASYDPHSLPRRPTATQQTNTCTPSCNLLHTQYASYWYTLLVCSTYDPYTTP